MIDYAEKRDFLRMPIDCELTFTQSGSESRHVGNVINLSHKGILFTSTEKFDEGDQLEIKLTPSNSETPPMQASVVVSRISYNNEVYEIACEIDDFRQG